MAYKIVRNSEPDFKSVSYTGECPKSGKKATVTTTFSGTIWRKTDLQKTYRPFEKKCSLLEGPDGVGFSPCIEDCPFVRDKLP